ncbi:MAG: rRNA maturation RNase YbeY [Rickettsiales bacterium]|nr:rRNA maturation RNase YbeY [Rickettsiales bacterium]
MTGFDLSLIMSDERWQSVSLDLDALLAEIVSAESLGDTEKQLALVLTNDTHIAEMNAMFRGKNKPTNVLSFPSDEEDEWGDVIVSFDTIAREAEEQHKVFESHAKHMIVHGVLHLLGYDHMEDVEAEEMEAKEVAILAQVGIENPYDTV